MEAQLALVLALELALVLAHAQAVSDRGMNRASVHAARIVTAQMGLRQE